MKLNALTGLLSVGLDGDVRGIVDRADYIRESWNVKRCSNPRACSSKAHEPALWVRPWQTTLMEILMSEPWQA